MPRPSQPILSTAIITTAALRAVDAAGDFTMPGIAEKLGVRPSSLYNHVSGRAEIIELMRGHVMAEVSVPGERDERWSETVTRLAREYRRSYAKHPRLIPLLTSQTVRTGVAFAMYNALAQAFSDGGFTPADVLAAITTLDSFVLGSALDLAAPEEVWAQVDEANDAMRAALATSVPNPARADTAFEFGLQTLVAGWLTRAQ